MNEKPNLLLWVEQRTNAVINIQRYDLNVKFVVNQKKQRKVGAIRCKMLLSFFIGDL